MTKTPRPRIISIVAGAVALMTVAAACGSDDSTGDEPVETADAADTTDAPEQPAETDAAETTDAPEEPAETDPAPEPEPEPETSEAASETVTATVGIANIAPVAALELVNDGFTDGMQECTAVEATLDYRNAEGDGSQLAPIIAEFLDSDVDMILAISTPVLQATVAANEADGRGTTVLFGAVTDPFAAGAAVGPDDKPEWLTGWQADAPVTGMFDIAAEVNPDATSIGVAYDPSQVNSEVALAKMQAEAETRGWTVETATIGDSSEVGTAANSLATRDIDFFFVPTDSILVNGLGGMVQVADDFDIPMIAQDSGITQAGAAIGTGLDYYGDGRRNAEYACEILQGNATAADYPIVQFEDELVRYSSSAAEAQGFEIPASVTDVGIDID